MPELFPMHMSSGGTTNTTMKTNLPRPSQVLSLLQPRCCPRGKEKMGIDSVPKGGREARFSSLSIGPGAQEEEIALT